MAKVIISTQKRNKITKAIERGGGEKVILPLKHLSPGGELSDFNLLICGEKKIGKTTLALQGEEMVLFLQHDPAQKAYRRLEILCNSWQQFLSALEQLEKTVKKGDFRYGRIVVDGSDNFYQNCMRHICMKLNISHPQDEAYGRGWDALKKEFAQGIRRLFVLPCSVWFICHSAWKEKFSKKKEENKELRLMPTLSRAAEEALSGLVDGWFAYDYHGSGRILYLRGTERIGAGHRIDNEEEGFPHFRDQHGQPLDYIKMGNSPKEAYGNLLNAFHNRYELELPKVKVKVRSKK